MVRADLHTHLRTGSALGRNDFNLAIDAASRRLDTGNGAVIGLANFGDNRYEKLISLPGGYEREYVGESRNAVYVPEKRIMAIKGQEIPTKEGHLLVLGLANNFSIPGNMTLERTIAAAKENCGVVIAPHPFYAFGIGNYLEINPHILEQIDAIEIHNGEASFGIPFTKTFPCRANRKARDFYNIKKILFPNLGGISSSDGHSFYEIGTSWVDMTMPSMENKKFYSSLKEEVRETRNAYLRHNGMSIFGAVKHVLTLAALIAKSKLGF